MNYSIVLSNDPNLDGSDKKKEMLQAYKIAQAAEVIYIDDSIEWVIPG